MYFAGIRSNLRACERDPPLLHRRRFAPSRTVSATSRRWLPATHETEDVTLATTLCGLGHVASRQQLMTHGAAARAIRDAVAVDAIRRIGRGIYACPHIDSETRITASAGVQIDCLSALDRHGVWSGIPAHTLHVRARPHHHINRLPRASHVHWSRQWTPRAGTEVSPVDALLQAMRCLQPIDWLASAESALHTGYLSEGEWHDVVRIAPQWMRPTIARLDRGAQSGFETHTREQLVSAGHRVRTQVGVVGASALDLLVDECVGVETDGEKWHGPERFIHDRTKDIVVEGHGIRVLRIGRPHIFDSWPRTLATIERMISDASRTQLRRSRRTSTK